MPSCDGSNCGACACEVRYETKYVNDPKQDREIKRLKDTIKKLEKELKEKDNLEDIISEMIDKKLQK